jgi:hypothetical protein
MRAAEHRDVVTAKLFPPQAPVPGMVVGVRAGVAALIVIAFLLPGCLSSLPEGLDPQPTETVFAADWWERALPNGDDHDHYDRDHHRGLSTPNFEVLGWDPLATDYHGMSASGYFCGDLAEGDARTLAVVHSFTSNIAFVLIDVTDPMAIFKIGEFVMESTHVWDVTMMPDQRHVVLATSPIGHLDEEGVPMLDMAPPGIWFRDACTGQERPVSALPAGLPFHSGVVLVDITTPAEPFVADFRPAPVDGGHSIVAQRVKGDEIILVTVSNPSRSDYYLFMTVTDTPVGAILELLSIHQTAPDSPEQLPRDALGVFFANHDGYLQEHPVTGEALAFLADGSWGVTVLNIDDPRAPRVIGRWDEPGRIANPDQTHFAHSILPIEGTWDGRHYTFISEECGGRPAQTPTCLVYSLDTTDPTDPTLAGAWTLPHDVGGWSYPGFSPHYMALIERTLFISHWHAGLWAVDVSTPEALREMPTIGVFVPDRDVEHVTHGTYGSSYNMLPVVADVIAYGGNLLIFDGTSGAYVLAFDATDPAPAPTPWPLNLP